MNMSQMFQVFSALCFIVGLLLLFYWIAKRFFIPWQAANNKSDIEVLETKMILPKKYISIVRVKGKVFAVAISEGSMTLISELDSDSFVSSDKKSDNVRTINFKDQLKKFYKTKHV